MSGAMSCSFFGFSQNKNRSKHASVAKVLSRNWSLFTFDESVLVVYEESKLGRNLMKTLARSFFVILFSGLFSAARPQGDLDSTLIEGAKKENRLVHWTTMTLSQSKQVVDAFQKKYPFIEVHLFRTGGDATLNKIFTEDRAGRYLWDVLLTRGDMFLPLMKKSSWPPIALPRPGKFPRISSIRTAIGLGITSTLTPWATTPSGSRKKRCLRPMTICSILNGKIGRASCRERGKR